MADEEVPDLLIFSKRTQVVGQKPAEQAQPAPQQKPATVQQPPKQTLVQQPAPQQHIGLREYQPHLSPELTPQPKAGSQPVGMHPYIPIHSADNIKSTPPPAQHHVEPTEMPAQEHRSFFHPKKRELSQDTVGRGALTVKDSLRLAKGQYCVNHQWRRAYAVCSFCKLPYCYVDIMEDEGKIYCLNDIDVAVSGATTNTNPASNSFSMISSVVLLANSVVLGYFMYPEAKFLTTTALSTGVLTFLYHVNSIYYIPIGNIAIAVLGIIAAVAASRKSIYAFGFSLLLAFSGLMLILYEYLNTSVPYLFISSALLLVSLASLTYSRMSSSHEVIADNTSAPDIEWPKPETF